MFFFSISRTLQYNLNKFKYLSGFTQYSVTNQICFKILIKYHDTFYVNNLCSKLRVTNANI